MRKYLLFGLFLLFLYSCCAPQGSESIPLLSPNFRGYIGESPEYFLLNCYYEHQILGERTGNYDSIIAEGNAVIIAPGNMVKLHSQGLNTMDADFYLRVPYGDGARFYFRAPGKDFHRYPSLVFEYTTWGSKLFEGKRLLASVDSIKLNNSYQSRIFIQNEGEMVHVIVGIDTVYQGKTKLPPTEFIYVEPINSKIIIDDVYFYPLVQK
ncbi:MAG: hypothetical protein ACK42Z_02120 [Candidatus Kapaibacteriota bacterium]